MSCQIYYYAPQGVDVQNLVGIDSAVTDLRHPLDVFRVCRVQRVGRDEMRQH